MKKILPIVLAGILILSGIGVGALSITKTSLQQLKIDEYDMVIIAPAKFSAKIQPLIDHKNDIGITTFLKTIEDIFSDYEGRDEAEQVKYFIKDAVETNQISYVLLIGGRKNQFYQWYVPVRYVLLDDGFQHPTYISDLYFADIYKNGDEFEDWDSDKDGLFAEWGEDILDLEPDVYIGRLPCRNRFEVGIVVDKIISYETTTYGKSWFNNAVFVGGDSFPDFAGNEGELTCDVAASYLNDSSITKLYASLETLSDPEDFFTSVNEGCGFLMTRCKGGTDRIRLPLLDGSELIYLQNKYMKQLKNKDKYPIMVLSECWHAKFDVTILNIFDYLKNVPDVYESDCIYECIAWRLARKLNGGAIAVLTQTHTCYGSYGDFNQNGINDDAEQFGGFLAVEVFRLFAEEGRQILGEVHGEAARNYVTNFPVNDNLYHCKSVQEWILIGDPSLMIGGYS